MELLPCPCCGFKTLPEIAADEICQVCWWHDDGQTDHDADEVRGGPNADLSLTQARLNFIEHGIFDPTRTDLKTKAKPKSTFQIGRHFVKNSKGRIEES